MAESAAYKERINVDTSNVNLSVFQPSPGPLAANLLVWCDQVIYVLISVCVLPAIESGIASVALISSIDKIG